MKFFKTAQNYVKGTTKNVDVTLIDETSSQESAEMFSKNYWFGDGKEGEQEETKDPWLPNMVINPGRNFPDKLCVFDLYFRFFTSILLNCVYILVTVYNYI